MSTTIKDADTGYVAHVTTDGELLTRSVTESEEIAANEKGNAYNINTGVITLTDANETSVMYLKNNENDNLVISGIVLGLWASDGDGLDMMTTFTRNPTTGDIITNENNVAINSNRNFGSGNSLLADAYVGASSETKTNGSDHILVRITEESRSFIGINEILPKGSSMGINVTPPTSNTSMNMYAAVICHLEN